MRSDEAGQVVQITPNSRHVLFKDPKRSGRIVFVDIATGEMRAEIESESIFSGFALSPDGRTLATAVYKDKVALWEVVGL